MSTYIVQIDLRPRFSESEDKYLRRVRYDLSSGLDGIVDGVTVQLLIDARTVSSYSLPLILRLLPALNFAIVADSAHTAREWARLTRTRVLA